MKSKYALYVFLLLLLLFSCSKSDQTYTIEIKDGVNYVHNKASLWGDEPKIELEFVQKIGVLDGKDENYLLFDPYDLVCDKEGNIYIGDSGNFRVQKFDMNGVYVATIGREGQGPGEFLAIAGMDIDENDNIFVSDSRNSRIQVFSSEGDLIKTIRPRGRIFRFRLLKSGNIIAWDYEGLRGESAENKISTRWLMAVYNSEGEKLNQIIKGFKYSFPNDFDGNSCYFDISDDSEICLSFSSHNRIEKHTEDGTPLFITDRPLKFDPTPEKEIQVYESGERTVLLFKFVAWSIGIDHKNRLWVVSLTKQPEKQPNSYEIVPEVDLIEIHIFDKEGILLCKLPSPVYFMSLRIFRDRLFLIDPDIEEAVYEYKIVEK